ncbi:MAG: CYTH domain-containing protein [Bacteroidia bacterium]|nr:CYTH domain-containing protein [Bacteroidia bacterium]MBT8269243.1 CYTH domain-containing protein [Bacteroidia bacterium]NNF83196.1 CYTH domain-containing protein [Flavobacteriaceae bacterium]NNK70813.1 CYTH domain-containing protein [Flavobacteriaceae bacterium]NNL78991.1 CYTH domain-containing protein [Flavobacteriaceae bacterium]
MEEIERKFLVSSLKFKKDAQNSMMIVQGFLNTHPERTVRIRKQDHRAQITVKGISSEDGLSRFEWEHEISLPEADALLNLCESGLIEKRRYEVRAGEHIFEVDEFLGPNKGLIIAEIELETKEEEFERPEWLGDEVTGDLKYYNSLLSKKPFESWNH